MALPLQPGRDSANTSELHDDKAPVSDCDLRAAKDLELLSSLVRALARQTAREMWAKAISPTPDEKDLP